MSINRLKQSIAIRKVSADNANYQIGFTIAEGEDVIAEIEELTTCISDIEAVSCGESQVADNDSDGMGWIYKRIQALKGGKDAKSEDI